MTNNKLTLSFTSDNGGELVKTCFLNSRVERSFVASRGRRLSPGEGSFRWSPGVRALSLFFLRYKVIAWKLAQSDQKIDDVPVLSGEEGTPAASLDYAISKEPAWLIDMFGTVQQGGAVALKSCLTRANPERKRPGPVQLFPVSRTLPPENVQVEIDGAICENPDQIISLVRGIQKSADRAAETKEKKRARSISTGKKDSISQTLISIFREESASVLQDLYTFNKVANSKAVEEINNRPMFKRLANGARIECVPDLKLSWGGRRGILPGSAKIFWESVGEEGLTIAVDAISVPVILLIKFLKEVRRLPIDITYNFVDTTEIIHNLANGGFPTKVDGMVVSSAAAATLVGRVGKKQYHSVTLLPKLSHAMVAAGGQRNSEADALPSFDQISCLVMNDIPGSSRYILECLVEKGHLDPSNIDQTDLDPDEVYSLLSRGDETCATIMFFPHYRLQEQLNNCMVYPTPPDVPARIENILFLHKRYHQTDCADLLNVEVRHAWSRLAREPELRDRLLNELFEDKAYIDTLLMCCGLNQGMSP